MIDEITRLMRLLEFSDSAFPVGTFSFSNGLETAAFEGIVYDAQTLEQYTRTALRQTIYSDAIAALIAFRAAAGGNYKTILEAECGSPADVDPYGEKNGRNLYSDYR